MQTAEYLLDKGLLDLVVPRSFLKGALFEIIDFYKVGASSNSSSIDGSGS
jgi:acetyl-CoA carboxylase carboxyl transferase subunit beta